MIQKILGGFNITEFSSVPIKSSINTQFSINYINIIEKELYLSYEKLKTMKEKKKFFNNNCLDKGHRKLSDSIQTDIDIIEKKSQYTLPLIEMLEYYQGLKPETLDKLINMAQKEQSHRHAINLIAINKNSKDIILDKVFLLVFIIFIAIITWILNITGKLFIAATFAFSSFAYVMMVSYFYSKNYFLRKTNQMKLARLKFNKSNRK